MPRASRAAARTPPSRKQSPRASGHNTPEMDVTLGNLEEDEALNDDQHGQPARLLSRMRKCVFMHHQLSCLLIHHAALDAGLYSEGGDKVMGDSAIEAAIADGNAALERSIQNVGGSTAELFSMTLRNRQDLASMGSNLQDQADVMISNMLQEFQLSDNFSAALKALGERGFPMTGNGRANAPTPLDSRSTTASSSGVGARLVPPPASEQPPWATFGNSASACGVADEDIQRDCDQLAAELGDHRESIAGLRSLLREAQEKSASESYRCTVSCFDEVGRAQARVGELESVLEELMSLPSTAADAETNARDRLECAEWQRMAQEELSREREIGPLRVPRTPRRPASLPRAPCSQQVPASPQHRLRGITTQDATPTQRASPAVPKLPLAELASAPTPGTPGTSVAAAVASDVTPKRTASRSREESPGLYDANNLERVEAQLRASQRDIWGM